MRAISSDVQLSNCSKLATPVNFQSGIFSLFSTRARAPRVDSTPSSIFVNSIGLGDLNASKDATAFWLKVGRHTETRIEQPVDPGPFHSHPCFVLGGGREQVVPLIYRDTIRYFIIHSSCLLFSLLLFFLYLISSFYTEKNII